MKQYKEWKQKHKVLTISCRDQDNTLEELIKYIKTIGNTGHSFAIVVDEGKKFYWDGDGSDAIFDIKSSASQLKKLD